MLICTFDRTSFLHILLAKFNRRIARGLIHALDRSDSSRKHPRKNISLWVRNTLLLGNKNEFSLCTPPPNRQRVIIFTETPVRSFVFIFYYITAKISSTFVLMSRFNFAFGTIWHFLCFVFIIVQHSTSENEERPIELEFLCCAD